jgi:UDP-glucose 4-epimerase
VTELDAFYRGRRVMVTGGLGFIGSTLAHRLVSLGANVLLVDALIPDLGGHPFNIHGIGARVRVDGSDLRDARAMGTLVRDRDVIFNLAGQVSHIDSMADPVRDLEINCRSHLSLLDACRTHNPRAKIVFASTRQVYGRPERWPVTEDHPVRPVDVNGANKAAAEYYHHVYADAYGLHACALRLTNVYGPRQLVRHARLGFMGWFIRLAAEGRDLTVFGDGAQFRDLVYVDDAVEAFLKAAASEACDGQVFNVGGDEPVSLLSVARLFVEVAGAGSVRQVPWPAERQAIDIGSFYLDSTKFRSTAGWAPRVPLREGLRRSIEYYRRHLSRYLETPAPTAAGTP